jgi:Xaa-Pro aminopeptidase
VNGRFSEPQRAVYEVVLRAQQAAIEAVHPDNHWNRPHEAATRVLVDGMLDLGLLSGDAEAIIDNGDYRRFFMHRTGHWLGMDVHDVGDYRVDGHWRQLEPGQVMTIEPGLYIPPDSDDVPERFRGIGVRIEDDVAVTKTGGEILGRNIAPKQVDDIEALMSS